MTQVPADGPSARRRYSIGAAEFDAAPAAPGLHVVATPIGNLADVTLRALATLAGVDAIACEDTRTTRVLLDRYAIATPTTPYHEHNAERARPALLARLAAGGSIALVSDAGTPLVSDPGYKLVEAAIAQGSPVIPLPGASAALAALVAAGLPTDRFAFEGFPPPKSAARRARFESLRSGTATLVFYESPRRLGECLADMAAVFGPRPAAVLREITKRFEEARRGTLDELARAHSGEPPKGEIVVVVAGAGEAELAWSDVEIDRALGLALAENSSKDAGRLVAEARGRPRRDVYARALALGRGRD